MLYVVSFGLWILILRCVPLVQAYTAAVGLTVCGTVLGSLFVLHEQIVVAQGIGVGFILFGIFLVLRH